MKLDGNEHLLLMSVSFSLIVPYISLGNTYFPIFCAYGICEPSQARNGHLA